MSFKEDCHRVIFGTDTPGGKLFDVVLIYAIVLSVIAVMLESIGWFKDRYYGELVIVEWFFTICFTIEYAIRLYSAPKPWQYARSFYGVVDLLSIVPTYLSFFYPDASYFLIVRLLRVLRVFRVLKLVRYLSEANVLLRSLWQSRRKIFIFFCTVLVLSTVFGSVMFLVEGPGNGFSSIPRSIYWTIVTITTVGYGDIIPVTPLGQVIAALAMLTGYSIIAVPTGIITAELANEMQRDRIGRDCRNCERGGHDVDAIHCKFCGAKM